VMIGVPRPGDPPAVFYGPASAANQFHGTRQVCRETKAKIALYPKPELLEKGQVGDLIVGRVFTRSGPRDLWQTPSRKYYVIREAGTRSYVTGRVGSGKLEVFTGEARS
jgi:hypothetical protein